MINELSNAMASRKGFEITNQVLDKTIEYAGYHFQTEEALMEQFSYPGMEKHKATHEAFRIKVTALKRQLDEHVATVPQELLEYLRSWLINHITIVDKELGLFLVQKGLS